MFGLSPLGLVHTLISLAALLFGVLAIVRHRRIAPQDSAGLAYLVATLLTALTSLFLFRRGGFGPAHALAVLTLVALAVGGLASWTAVFGRATRYIQSAAMSATVLFHAVPGVTETLTRLPPSQPLLHSPEAPQFKAIYGALLAAFAVAVVLQWVRLRRRGGQP